MRWVLYFGILRFRCLDVFSFGSGFKIEGFPNQWKLCGDLLNEEHIGFWVVAASVLGFRQLRKNRQPRIP